VGYATHDHVTAITSTEILIEERELVSRPRRMPLRILIIGINYAPELTGIAPYTTAVAEHYARQGHRVRVITGLPHYPEWRRMSAPASSPGANPHVSRYWHFVPRRATALHRMLYEMTWLVSASRGVLRARADVVIGIVPNLSDGLLALLARRRWHARVGLVVKDLMGPAAAQSGYRGGAAVAGLTAKLERYIARRAGRIAIISSGFQRYLERGGVPAARFHRVRDWSHDSVPTESIQECRRRLGWSADDFVCLHAGNMGQKQGLETVLEAARLLQEKGIKVVFSGSGNDRSRLLRMARHHDVTNSAFLDLQPAGQYEAMLRAADVLLLNQRVSVGDMSLPSKLASYFASGRPVIAAVAADSEAASEVVKAKAGVVVPAGDPNALATAVLRLRDQPALAATFGAQGKVYADRFLTPEGALRGYDDFLDSVLEGTSKGVEMHTPGGEIWS
jgi:colanic acid biosynthesis glycosyl transferase WcaI